MLIARSALHYRFTREAPLTNNKVMNITLTMNPLGVLEAPPSKSEAHRLLICAALAGTETKIACRSLCEDTWATAECLNSLGADIGFSDGILTARPIEKRKEIPLLDCGESGSTLRFLLPVSLLYGGARFTGRGRLPKRPLSELLSELERHGARFSDFSLPLSATGEPQSGEYKLPGSVSSQFVSGLLFALPTLNGDSEIELTGGVQSLSYINMTLNALSKFGVRTTVSGNRLTVPGGQRYISPGFVKVGGDWSNAAFSLCAGALKGSAVLTGLDVNSESGDRAVLDALKAAGAEVKVNGDTVAVAHRELKAFDTDCADIPDLVPPLCVLAAACRGDSHFYNAGRLRLKESDRLSTCAGLIKSLGGKAEIDGDTLIVYGGELKGGEVDGCGDHRIVMAAAIASSVSKSPVKISGAEAVNKSYPDFFTDFSSLGGTIIPAFLH